MLRRWEDLLVMALFLGGRVGVVLYYVGFIKNSCIFALVCFPAGAC